MALSNWILSYKTTIGMLSRRAVICVYDQRTTGFEPSKGTGTLEEEEQHTDVGFTCECGLPGEWLKESDEASDREWREAALLALRVTGPSRTGG